MLMRVKDILERSRIGVCGGFVFGLLQVLGKFREYLKVNVADRKRGELAC